MKMKALITLAISGLFAASLTYATSALADDTTAIAAPTNDAVDSSADTSTTQADMSSSNDNAETGDNPGISSPAPAPLTPSDNMQNAQPDNGQGASQPVDSQDGETGGDEYD